MIALAQCLSQSIKADGLFSYWEVCIRNIVFLGEQLWRFFQGKWCSMEGTIKNVVYTPMDGVPTFWLGSRIVAIEAIDQNFLIFSHCTYFSFGDSSVLHCWESLWWGDKPLSFQFPYIYLVSGFKDSSIFVVKPLVDYPTKKLWL